MQEIIFYGRGGQGAASAAALAVTAFDKEGKCAQAFPFFGSERRGAPIRAFLRIDERPIVSRVHVYNPDCIVVLDPKLPSIIDITQGLKEGGIAILNAKNSPESVDLGVRLSRVATVDATQIAETVFGAVPIPLTNLAMLGAFAATTGWVSLSSVIEASYSKYADDAAKKNERAARMAFAATRVAEFTQ